MTNTITKITYWGDDYMLPQQKALVITLTSAGWTNNEQTVTATWVTASNSVIISPAPTYINDYTDAKIYCSAQGTDSLTFTCDSTPASDIEVNVLVLSAEAESQPTPPSPWWQPWVNTVAYYPLTATSTTSDLSWNNYTLSWNGTYSFGDYAGVSCCYINVGSFSANITSVTASDWITESIWYYEENTPINDNWLVMSFITNTSEWGGSINWIDRAKWRPWWKQWFIWLIDDGLNASTSGYSVTWGTWYHLCYTYSGSTMSLYVNWTLVWTATKTDNKDTKWCVVLSRSVDLDRGIRGYVSNAIFEDKARTAQEVSDYFDLTKWDYWIS